MHPAAARHRRHPPKGSAARFSLPGGACMGLSESSARSRTLAAVPSARLRILTPDAAPDEIDSVPSDDAEQPGMGATVGGVVGTAVGAAIASLVAPQVGVAAVAGIAGGALLGLGGGALAGDALEEALSVGVTRDEL